MIVTNSSGELLYFKKVLNILLCNKYLILLELGLAVLRYIWDKEVLRLLHQQNV
jgi:hypothetical protein